MAGRTRKAQGTLGLQVEQLTRELAEAREQQAATAAVLKAISRSALELNVVLSTLIGSARRLCAADRGGEIFNRVGDTFRFAASEMDCGDAYLAHEQQAQIRPGRGTLVGRVALERQVVHVHDAWSDPDYEEKEQARAGGFRAMLGVPLLRDGELIGAFALARSEPVPFTARQVSLVQTFADQAVIAIENARLFDEVQQRTKELQQSLDDLRAAQDRLVQTEKLASLGQLTAGIAHEIKNPLNFVNNFADLSVELVDELETTLGKAGAALDPQIRDETSDITNMLKGNLVKVVSHGKRADSIVRNMLAHSRESSKEPRVVDLNAIVEEALNLAYHGARAEKPSFDITLEKDLDPKVGQVELYPQEFTRVLLNLVGNGFHAAAKKRVDDAPEGYKPTLRVSTRAEGDRIKVSVHDNGTGIPPAVKARIFDPFFTTKPTGEGTGLGLSLSHDIVVKQHGGSIDVTTEPGRFTELTVTLPRRQALDRVTEGRAT